MKQCPTCQSQYTDDTLQFCLQDGSPLGFLGDSPESQTIASGEQETVVSNRQSSQFEQAYPTNPTHWNPNTQQSNPALPAAPPPKKSNATMAVFVTVFAMLLLFGLVGIGAWLYFRGATPDEQGNLFITKSTPYPETESNRATNANTTTSKSATTATPLTSNSDANSAVDAEQVKREVAERVNSWKSASETLDLDAHMSHYAGSVDYYKKRGANVGFIRADKQRAFSSYDSINFTLSNMTVTVVPATKGERAIAVFDKEWNFSGAQKNSSGKVQQELKLKKENGRWLITSERDLRVY